MTVATMLTLFDEQKKENNVAVIDPSRDVLSAFDDRQNGGSECHIGNRHRIAEPRGRMIGHM